MLTDRGHKVATATSGRDALARLDDAEAVVTDLAMPGMDGWTLLQRLRADELFSHIPVIIVSANTNADERLTGSHAVVVVSKPFTLEALLDAVRGVTETPDTG